MTLAACRCLEEPRPAPAMITGEARTEVLRDAGAGAAGRDHTHAMRILGRAWNRVIWRCWIHGAPPDLVRDRAAATYAEQTAA